MAILLRWFREGCDLRCGRAHPFQLCVLLSIHTRASLTYTVRQGFVTRTGGRCSKAPPSVKRSSLRSPFTYPHNRLTVCKVPSSEAHVSPALSNAREEERGDERVRTIFC